MRLATEAISLPAALKTMQFSNVRRTSRRKFWHAQAPRAQSRPRSQAGGAGRPRCAARTERRSGGGGSFPRPASHVVVTVTVVDLARFKVEGAAVVQIFAAPLSASRTGVVRRKKMLVGFAKVWVPASGEGVAVDVHVRAEELGYTVYNPRETGAKNHPWVVESGEVRLLACFSECDCPLQTTIIVV